MKPYTPLLLMCSLLTTMLAHRAHAEPMFSPTQCIGSNWSQTGWAANSSGYNPGDPIYFYIQEDFGTQLQVCLDQDTSLVSEIKNIPVGQVDALVGNVIQSAAETWNLETRGTPLMFGGYINANSANEACAQMQKPAVFVRFRPRCLFSDLLDINDLDNDMNVTERIPDILDLNGNNNRSEGAPDVFDLDGDGSITDPWPDIYNCFKASSGTVNGRSIGSCQNTIELTMWGDFNSITEATGCDASNNGIRAWGLDGEDDTNDLKDLMVHEFGHVVGLGHPQDLPSQTPPVANPVNGAGQRASVMERQPSNPPFNDTARGRHLFPWDVDCANDLDPGSHRGERSVRYAWQGFNSSGTPAASIAYHDQWVAKGFRSGGYVRKLLSRYFALYLDDHVARSIILGDGSFNFFDQSLFNKDEIENLFYPPSFMSPLEVTGTDQQHRINFAAYDTTPPSAGDFSSIDPPQIAYVRDDDMFTSGAGPFDYEVCTNTTYCWFPQSLQSHIPLVSAWSGTVSVMVTVNTDRDNTNHGEITVHPGFFDPSLSILKQGSILSENKQPPSTSAGGNDLAYTLKTDVAPAVTCAPGGFPWYPEYNCFLAWVDRGISNGKILYTYFKVENGAIVWEPTIRATVRGASNPDIETVSAISAAYFDDALWLAWKSNDETPDVLYVKHSVSGWESQPTRINSGKVLDPPTWVYVPDGTRESALVWTEIP